MIDLQLHLRLAGASLILLALAHFDFSKRFHWSEELAKLSPLNRQIFWVHNLFICLILVQMGLLSLLAPQSMLEHTPLGKYVALGFVSFWIVRLFTQWFVYDMTLWRGKRFETAVHIIFTCLWSYYVVVFGAVAWKQFHGP